MDVGYDKYEFKPGFEPGNIGQCSQPLPPDGRGVPEQFWNCAEVSISNSCGSPPSPPTNPLPTPPTPITPSPTPNPTEPVTSPPTNFIPTPPTGSGLAEFDSFLGVFHDALELLRDVTRVIFSKVEAALKRMDPTPLIRVLTVCLPLSQLRPSMSTL